MKEFFIQKVAAFDPYPPTTSPSSITLNCPASILNEFRKTLTGGAILGAKFYNPYTCEVESLPYDADHLTSLHLQVLARNEFMNVDGKMKVELYNGLLSSDQISRIRCLVKATTVAGKVMATHTGGYRFPRQRFAKPQEVLLIDQAGLQWQDDYRNTGGLHFYPEDPAHRLLPEGYMAWQGGLYEVLYGYKRPAVPSTYKLPVVWGGVRGCVDLESVSMALAVEFTQALDAVVNQGNADLEEGARINFKFCRAGMGFFSSGLMTEHLHSLRVARLEGIAMALERILDLPERDRAAKLGKIGRLVLPHSNEAPYSDRILSHIGRLVQSLGIEWGGAPEEDPFKPHEGLVTATTNCADPHAMPGNEGGPSSVDACISYNANINHHNAAYNKHMRQRLAPEFDFSPAKSPTIAHSVEATGERAFGGARAGHFFARTEDEVKEETKPIRKFWP